MKTEECFGCLFAREFFDKSINHHMSSMTQYCAIFDTIESYYSDKKCPCVTCIVKMVCETYNCAILAKFLDELKRSRG